jgi:hypothetical protein
MCILTAPKVRGRHEKDSHLLFLFTWRGSPRWTLAVTAERLAG